MQGWKGFLLLLLLLLLLLYYWRYWCQLQYINHFFFFVLGCLAVEENLFYLNIFPLEGSHNGLKCQDRRRQVAFMKQYHMEGIKLVVRISQLGNVWEGSLWYLNGVPSCIIYLYWFTVSKLQQGQSSWRSRHGCCNKSGERSDFIWFVFSSVASWKQEQRLFINYIVTRLVAGRPEESGFDPDNRRVFFLSTASTLTVEPIELPAWAVVSGVERPGAWSWPFVCIQCRGWVGVACMPVLHSASTWLGS